MLLPFTAQADNGSLQYLKTDFSGVFIWLKFGRHLLIWMYVIPEIPQYMTELLYIQLQESQFAGYINELGECPLMKCLDFPRFILRTIGCLIELLRILKGYSKENPFEYTAA
ncbi:MAG: hypothetical protein DDT32_02116 [Syntrophomonadaceae bacterium]|nr:hypothetical protein [Bacillota bacterium]MBT9148344.1 hypothetical protein [Bacillota bacterium]